MLFRIEHIDLKQLIGLSITTSFTDDKTFLLWRTFMPRRNEIQNKVNSNLHSVQVYKDGFNMSLPFTKWAAIEVNTVDEIPDGMEELIIPGGLYAVFIYKGDQSGAASFFKEIFTKSIPAAGYELDNRPHFEILGDKYKINDVNSEEEVWIPVKNRI